MKTLFIVSLFVTMSLVFVSPLAIASGSTATFGTCIRNADTSLRPYQAPGQSNNGPMVRVNGELSYPPSFDGGMTCNK